LVMAGCEDEKPVQNDMLTTEENKFSAELSDIELRLADLAGILPEALTDPELAGIVYAEAKRNEADEPYALWREIADRPTQSGVTLRSKVRDVLMKRTRGKTRADAMSFTAELDGTDHLQVYVHNFEEWNGASAIPSTFTPLTVNDVDVGELTLYDSLGNASALDVNAFYDSSETSGSGKMRMIPTYAIAIVGINESAAMAAATGSGSGNTGGNTSTQQVKITEIKLKKNAWWYEPWWLGKAEVYFVHFVPEKRKSLSDWVKKSDGGGSLLIPEEWWNMALGERTGYKKYKVWKWKKRWWGGYYKQNKPWRTMDYNTNWSPNDFDYSKDYRLKVLEYDWPGYDRGVDFWCLMAGVDVGTDVTKATGGNVLLGIAAGIGTALVCDIFIINDDQIGGKTGFQNKVQDASNNQGVIFQWNDSDWEIKLKVE
ncbi:hypothetical protein JYT44_03420, partial [Caldithrix abyssi]|nr:hypothetical protein [Caldithrix abyssi]